MVITDNYNSHKASMKLIFLCWLAYSITYIGKVNYSATIKQVMDFYGKTHSEAGLANTLLFFSYGAMQIVNGILVKKYNPRFMVFLGLFLSGIINLIVGLTDNFTLVLILWFFNGIAQAFLWTSIIRIASENLAKRYMAKASVILGTTVALGTFIAYGLSALFVYFNFFKLIFLVAGVLLPVVGVIWFVGVPSAIKNIEPEDETDNLTSDTKISANNLEIKIIYLTVAVFLVMAVATNLIKDGLVTWVPSILIETYNLDPSISIILTLSLPLIAIFGNYLAVKVNKKIPDYVTYVTLMLVISAVLIGVVIAGLSLNQFVLTIICFAIVCLLVSSNNSMLTAIYPLFMKGKVNSGLIAGLINGFCYVGSTISSYGLGAVREHFGSWTAVLWLLLIVCVAMVAVFGVYLVIKKIVIKNHNK